MHFVNFHFNCGVQLLFACKSRLFFFTNCNRWIFECCKKIFRVPWKVVIAVKLWKWNDKLGPHFPRGTFVFVARDRASFRISSNFVSGPGTRLPNYNKIDKRTFINIQTRRVIARMFPSLNFRDDEHLENMFITRFGELEEAKFRPFVGIFQEICVFLCGTFRIKITRNGEKNE